MKRRKTSARVVQRRSHRAEVWPRLEVLPVDLHGETRTRGRAADVRPADERFRVRGPHPVITKRGRRPDVVQLLRDPAMLLSDSLLAEK